MKRIAIALAAILFTILGAGAAQAGGRATVTIVSAPASVTAGKSFNLVFALHPEWPGARNRTLEPTVKAACGDQSVTFDTVALEDGKKFRASMTLPSEGRWTVTVDSRYCETRMKALTLKASPASRARS